MALEIPNIKIDAIDKSEIALRNVLDNINYYHCEHIINPYQLDILEEVPNHKYDVIVSNPPYIPLDQIASLEHSVQYYDPMNALTDYSDGMTFYRRIFEISSMILNKGGFIIFEFGTVDQRDQIINIFNGYTYDTFNDLSNNPRVILFQS